MTSAALRNAIAFARRYAEAGLKHRPFDPVYLTTLDQLAVIGTSVARYGDLRGLRSGEITLGLMAAKELRNEEADFAHALHVIQRKVDTAAGNTG